MEHLILNKEQCISNNLDIIEIIKYFIYKV